MAEKRMMAKSIVLSDDFLDMPTSTRCLYFTLLVSADDDGFVGNPKTLMRQIGAAADDMKLLLTKQYVIGFDTGVLVIKHWRIHNYIRSDRYKPTVYAKEKSTLVVNENGEYYNGGIPSGIPRGIPSDYQVGAQNRLDKISINKNNINKGFTPPTVDEVRAYCDERNNGIDAESFVDYYASQKWKKANGRPLADWKAAVRQWESRRKEQTASQPRKETAEERTNKLLEEARKAWNEEHTM